MGLEKALAKYDQASKEAVKEIITELKKRCKDYGELNAKLNQFERDVLWGPETKNMVTPLFQRMKDFLEEEKNGLPLTNRSQEES